MSELKKHFERLMDFAKQNNFHKPFLQVYFVEDKNVRRLPEKPDKLSRQNIFALKDYENRFNEILEQGHSWINLHFAGMVNDSLLILIELPNYKNNAAITTVNLSLAEKSVVENDWNISIFMEIV